MQPEDMLRQFDPILAALAMAMSSISLVTNSLRYTYKAKIASTGGGMQWLNESE
jgi:cation transport ATPase